MQWIDNHIEIEPPRNTRKITGTRFAGILGLNHWTTPFELWCDITKTYKEPFEDTIYTIAGKTIEPKQAEYMKTSYGMTNLITPTDVFGKDPFKKTYGDFFHDKKIFGGMWDYLLVDEEIGEPNTVLEMKTTKRIEDWKNDIPEYYAMQAALYAYLLGVENVIMVASFLGADDYKCPEKYICTTENTIAIPFKLHERYPDFENLVNQAKTWYLDYVETGISPDYDKSNKTDAEILKALANTNLTPDTDFVNLINEAERLKNEIEITKIPLRDKESRLKEIQSIFKSSGVEELKNHKDQKTVTLRGTQYQWVVSKNQKNKFDEKQFKNDYPDLFKKYSTENETYTLRAKEIKVD